MSNDIGKISVRQLMILFIILYFSPAIRYIPLFSTIQAKQAAWISPVFGFVLGMIYTFVWWAFLKRYDKESFLGITKDILGKKLGSIISIMYFIWITFLLAYNLRIYSERLTSTVLTGVSTTVILASMLILVIYVMKNGIVVLAKMSEVLVIILFLIFFALTFFILPELEIKNLFPITYKDIFPAFKGSFGILAIFAYNIVIMIFNDKIDHKGEFERLSTKTMAILSIMSLLVIIIPLCVFGSSILVKIPIPYLSAISQISLFHIIERLEAAVVIFWVISDFVLLSVFLYSAIHIVKLHFNLSSVKPLISIYALGILFLSLIIAKSSFELKTLSENVITQLNIIMGLILPMIVFGVGKIRKKV